MLHNRKVFKLLLLNNDMIREKFRSLYNTVKGTGSRILEATKNKGLVAFLTGITALGAVNIAKGEDLTSFAQLYSDTTPPTNQFIYNLDDGALTVNGLITDRLTSLGFGKYISGSAIVGFADQDPTHLDWVSGGYHGNHLTSIPSNDLFNLVLNERPSADPSGNFGIAALWDYNDNGRFGTIVSGVANVEDNELYYNLNDFKINGIQGNIAALPAFTGSGFLKLPQIDVQVIPEPATLGVLLTGAAAAVMAGRRRHRR